MWDDKTFLSLKYRLKFGNKLDLDNPRTYNEKCNWLKLNHRIPLYTKLVDKIEVKKYVDEILGPGHTFPLLEVWDSPDEIDFDKLPNQFVLKCNHNSGVGLCICKDKANGIIRKGKSDDTTNLTFDDCRKFLRKGLEEDFYLSNREWPYKNVKRKVFAEKYMVDSNGEDLHDYKFFCFDGEPLFIWSGTNYTPMYFDIYTADWKNCHVEWGYSNAPKDQNPPEGLETMLVYARKLSKGIPHVRVDFYNIGGHIYFGEFTFYTWGAFETMNPKEWEYKFGDLIKLPGQITK